MNAAAPNAFARSARPCSSKPLKSTTRVVGEASSTSGSASSPSTPGIETSRSMRSGECSRASSMACVSVGALADHLEPPGHPEPRPHQEADLGGVVDDHDRGGIGCHETTLPRLARPRTRLARPATSGRCGRGHPVTVSVWCPAPVETVTSVPRAVSRTR